MSQGFEYASGCKYARARNMARLWMCEGYTGCWMCLNKPGYSLIMPQYVWACINNAEYASIYLNKESFNMPELLMCLMQCMHKVIVQNTEQLLRQRSIQKFKMECFAKRIMPECRRATRDFPGQGRFRGTKALWQTFRQKHMKRTPPRETFWSFFS